MRTIEVVTAIIERDGKVLLAQRPAQSDQAGLWEFVGSKVEPDESQWQALVCKLREELGIEVAVGEYVTSYQREISGRIIHLHVWHIPDFHGTLQAHEHQVLVWYLPEKALQYPLVPVDISLSESFITLRAARPADQCQEFCHPTGIAAVLSRPQLPYLQNNFYPDKRSTEYRVALTARLNRTLLVVRLPPRPDNNAGQPVQLAEVLILR